MRGIPTDLAMLISPSCFCGNQFDLFCLSCFEVLLKSAALRPSHEGSCFVVKVAKYNLFVFWIFLF
jgi:hypothetical protein